MTERNPRRDDSDPRRDDRNPRRTAPPPWTVPHPLLADILRTDTAKALQADDMAQGFADYEEIDGDIRIYIDKRMALLDAVLLDEVRRLLMRVLKATATSAKGARLAVDGLRSIRNAIREQQAGFGDEDEGKDAGEGEGEGEGADDDMGGDETGYTTNVIHSGSGPSSAPAPAPAPAPAIQMEPVGDDGPTEPPQKRTRRAQPEA